MPELRVHRWPQSQPLERESVATAWARDGFGCDLWVDPPGQEWIGFVHATDERVVVQEGSLEFEVEGARAMLGPGDQVLIPAGSRHSVWNRGSTTARWFYGYQRH
ncbi:MAG TPA: cupin domain-containing protein [Terriglobia bacterium]|nr:cupin domain-containing protein [Terriglobia bacterium]